MKRLKEMETIENKTRNLALKSKAVEVETNEESSDECSEFENLNLLTKRF